LNLMYEAAFTVPEPLLHLQSGFWTNDVSDTIDLLIQE